jgi:glycosyltransferase involved in cell wall biosynthesis
MNGGIDFTCRVLVVVPAFKVSRQIQAVVQELANNNYDVIVVDDCCPDSSGQLARALALPCVSVIKHQVNMGVGAAVKSGYEYAMANKYDIVLKFDGDGQMSVSDIPRLLEPLVSGVADYVKGNRFTDSIMVQEMPMHRRVGNIALSYIGRVTTGYYHLFDINNGLTGIHSEALNRLCLKEISNTYFFESDMIAKLRLVDAVVMDVPSTTLYANEFSSLSIPKTLITFPFKHLAVFVNRILELYIRRSLNLPIIIIFFLAVYLGIFGAMTLLNFLSQLRPDLPVALRSLFVGIASLGLASVLFIIVYRLETFYSPKVSLVARKFATQDKH